MAWSEAAGDDGEGAVVLVQEVRKPPDDERVCGMFAPWNSTTRLATAR